MMPTLDQLLHYGSAGGICIGAILAWKVAALLGDIKASVSVIELNFTRELGTVKERVANLEGAMETSRG